MASILRMIVYKTIQVAVAIEWFFIEQNHCSINSSNNATTNNTTDMWSLLSYLL